MHISSCLHPKRIRNPYTHEMITVPCGKCDACLVARSNRWIERLECEVRSWKYCLFFTLTYDNAHVPTAVIKNGFVQDFSGKHTAPKEVICFSIDHMNIDDKEKEYVKSLKTIQYLSHYDAQCFLKRVRQNLRNNFKRNHQNEEESFLRFYLVGEYGPTNYRPHYHGLLFFNSNFSSSCIEEVVRSSWSFGFVDTSFAKFDACKYVARYLNCTSHLPEVYNFSRIRQFAHFSKCPPIGSMFISSEKVREIFDQCSPTMCLERVDKRKVDDVALWRFLEDRLFPKCPSFGRLSHFDRVRLYRATQNDDFSSVDEFVRWCKSDGVNKSDRLHELLREVSSNYWYSSTLRNLYYISSHVVAMSAQYEIDVATYVSHIEKYYQNKDYENLKKYYQFQENYVIDDHPVQDLVHLNSGWLYSIFDSSFTEFDHDHPDFQKICLQLESYGIDVQRFFDVDLTKRKEYFDSLSLFGSVDYKELAVNRHKILKDSTKTKKKNDYLNEQLNHTTKSEIYEQFISRVEAESYA